MVREGMRGADHQQNHMFSYLSPEMRVRKDHPLRTIRAMVDEVLTQLSRRFDAMYARVGRPSIPPEKLLRLQLLQMLYSIRSERLLMEEIDYSMLFRWFVGLNLDEEVWDATSFTKNRDRLLEADVAKEFLAQVVEQARAEGLTSDEHFTVDGTLLEAWASLKSFQPKEATKRMRKPRSLTVEEFQLFLEHLEEPIRTIALVCVCLGLRISECLALRWSDVDWLNSKLRVERGIVRQQV